MIYTFGTFKLDTTKYELYDNDRLSKLDVRGLELLIYLVESRDHVVSRQEFETNVWQGSELSEGVLHNCIMSVRKVMRDGDDGQPKIKNVYGKGYRFVAETQEQNPITRMFKESEPHDDHRALSRPSSLADSSSGSQNVFVGNYNFVSVLCGTLAYPETLVSCFGFESTLTLRQTFFSLAKAEAHRHEGVFKLYGADGFLIFFGLPVRHRNHVKWAVEAGLRIQEGLSESCDALDPQSPVDPTVQMGLHTGLIEIQNHPHPLGFVKLTRSETTALAIRLHYLAKGGEFLTSKATIPYIEEMAEYVEYDTIPIPSQSQPTQVYRICGVASQSTDLSPT